MKKSTKILFIGGILLCAAGLIIMILVGAICGSVKISQMLKNGDFAVQIGNGFWGINSDLFSGGDDEEEMLQRHGSDMKTGNVNRELLGTNAEIKNLSIQYGTLGLKVKESEDENFYITVDIVSETGYGVEKDGTLYIEQFGNVKLQTLVTDAGEIVLYIPKDFVFEDVKMELGVGEIYIQNIHANSIEVGGKAGEIKIEKLTAGDARFDMGAGEVEIKNGEVDCLNMEVSMGDGQYKGSINKTCNASCSAGEMSLKIKGKEEDFNYNISCSAGEIKVGSLMEGDGVSLERIINNGVEKEINAECSLGEIDIEFFK